VSEPESPVEPYPDTLDTPDACWHFGVESQTFLAHWCALAGVPVEGSAMVMGEGASLAILLSTTGEMLTPQDIAKRANKGRLGSVK
jgi:hypothetical protein